jgi:hypothetical protein
VNKGRDLDVNDTRQIALSLAEMRGVQLPAMSAGAKMDHRAPRERRFVAV